MTSTHAISGGNPKPVERLICSNCELVTPTGNLLRAPNPFDLGDNIAGCPHCLTPADFLVACDYDDCAHPVTSGTPMPDGRFLRRCYQHSPRNPEFAPDTEEAAA